VSWSVADLPSVDRLLEGATPYALAVSASYAVVLAAVAAEVAWLARGPGRRRVLVATATAAAMATGALIVSVPYSAAFRVLWEAMARWRWDGAAEAWEAHPIVGAVAAFVAWDLSGWVYHLIGHRTRIGWAAHQPHHTGPDFDATLGLRQSWLPVHGLVCHPPLALAGFDLRVILVCAALSSCWQVLEHTSLELRFPRWFAAVVMTPAAHRHHHGRSAAVANLGPVLTIWDRLAGTWVPPDTPAPEVYGLPASSSNPVTVELAGWRQLARRRLVQAGSP
jgi:sterol desaturase/sphingolipid hydroxylase (fatty acid hydroxylase superfamily)